MDRGANGGILGNDAKVYVRHQRHVDVTGIDNHELNSLQMVDGTAKIITQNGPAIVILRQYAYHGTGRSIHSAGQIEYYKNKVDDRSMKVGGTQCIRTVDGYVIPLDIINGLPYLKMEPHTDKEFQELPHIILTSGEEWDPRALDNTLTDKDDWYNTLKDIQDGLYESPFDEYGNYRHRHVPENVQKIPDPAEPESEDTETTEPESDDTDDTEANFRECYFAASNLNRIFVSPEPTTDFLTALEHEVDDRDPATIEAAPPAREIKKKPIDYEKYRPYFLHAPIEKIRKTFQNTTQHAVNVVSGHNILQTLKSPYPANNVWRRNEALATDTMYAEVPAVCTNGQTMCQFYCGRKSLVISVHGMSTEKEFVNTLEDEIRERGAPDMLISDSAQVEQSKRIQDILRSLQIKHWKSEPKYQHQNPAERRWKTAKAYTNWYMNWRNVDEEAWLLCLKWVADVMNHMSEKSLGDYPPLQRLLGSTIDISILLCFLFWDIVYVARYKDHQYKGQIGSKKSSEIRGRFVGFAWDVGHALTFKILTDDTKRIICRSRVRLAVDGENNLKLDAEAGVVPKRIYIKSNHDSESGDVTLPTIDVSEDPFVIEVENDKDQGEQRPDATEQGEPPDAHSPMSDPLLRDQPVIETVDENDAEDVPPHIRPQRQPGEPNPDQKPVVFTETLKTLNPTVKGLPPDEMVDRTFLMPPQEDGTRVRAKIIEKIKEHKAGMQDIPELVKFRCLVNDEYEEVVAYNDIVDYIEQDDSWDGTWKFKEILAHQGPLDSKDPRRKGSRYNVQVLWETGEITWRPLTTNDGQGVYDTDPVTVAIYAREHGLLDTPGWRMPYLKKLAKTQRRIIRRANQAKLHSFRTKPIYMYGFQVPRNHEQAMDLDRRNGNTKWRDSELLELGQIQDYQTFQDLGKGGHPGPDYKKITVHMVYAVKHDGRHKSRLVAGGHLTETPIDSVYSSVVSLRGIRILTFLGELNEQNIWVTDIGNAYLESKTKEKVFIIAGPEFGDLEGHTLVIKKAIYGLCSSGLRWHERFSDVLREMGFFPSKAEPDIWMREKDGLYEYIGVYVDDLLMITMDPMAIITVLQNDYNFKLKGSGPISFHLGCDFYRDEDGNLCYAPKRYIEKMLENYRRIFGQNPRKASSPLVKGDHPELDSSELLDEEWTKIYQSLIGALQWVIQIGRWDVSTGVMTLSRFRACPRQGHLDRVKRIHGYLLKMKNGVIRIRTEEPDYSSLPEKVYDWSYTCYEGAREEIPHDAPQPLGKPVRMTSYVDANLYHDLISGRSVTGILHLFNKTPIDTFSKLQSTVETATFGSEYVATRTCTEQIIDLRNTLRYLGVPIRGSSMMFGDNESVVNTASVPHSKLTKRHNALSYHRTREAIAAKVTQYFHIAGKTNPADILSKHWDLPAIWDSLRPLMFWYGDTADLIKEEDDEQKDSNDTGSH